MPVIRLAQRLATVLLVEQFLQPHVDPIGQAEVGDTIRHFDFENHEDEFNGSRGGVQSSGRHTCRHDILPRPQ